MASSRKTGRFNKRKWKHISMLCLVAVLFAALLFLIIYYYNFITPQGETEGEPVEFLYNIGKETGEGALNRPLSVAVSENKVYVTDSLNGKIKVFTSKGSFLFSFSLPTDQPETYPAGITIGPGKNIYVSEIKSRRLMVFDSDGNYLHDFPKEHKVMIKPLALTYSNEKFYVTDIGDHTIKIFSLGGKLLQTIGKYGNEIEEFLYPNGVAVDKNGRIYVADSNNGRIQVFNSDGKFEFEISDGGPEIALQLPKGVAIDNLNRIHVADIFARAVLVFSGEGKFLFSYGQNEESILTAPNDVAIGLKDDKIFVADRTENIVRVWTY